MADKLVPGVEAPNFDLTSTEDVVLMLRDEVPRMAVVVYFFADPGSERARRDLQALAQVQNSLTEKRAVILGISRTKVDGLKQVQRDLKLRFPLLFDDRDFSAAYGIEAPEEGDPEPALFVVDRDQKILWAANPVGFDGRRSEGDRRHIAGTARADLSLPLQSGEPGRQLVGQQGSPAPRLKRRL